MNEQILEKIKGIDFDQIATEILRDLRGSKSQGQINNSFGFDYNKVAKWENNELSISWQEFLRYTSLAKKDMQQYFRENLVYNGNIESIAEIISHLIKNIPLEQVAASIGCSKATLYRWIKGETEPGIKFILKIIVLVDANFLKFFSAICNISNISALDGFTEMEKSKDVFFRYPLIAAILRVIELREYETLPTHQEGFISKKLGIDDEEEKFLLSIMLRHHFISYKEEKYIALSKTINTAGNRKLQLETMLFWQQQSKKILERLYDGQSYNERHLWMYNVFGTTAEAREMLRKKALVYNNEIITILSSEVNRGAIVDVTLLQFGLQSLLGPDPIISSD